MLTKHNYYGHEIEILMPLHFSRGKHSQSHTHRGTNKVSVLGRIRLDSPLEAQGVRCSHLSRALDGRVEDREILTSTYALEENGMVSVTVDNGVWDILGNLTCSQWSFRSSWLCKEEASNVRIWHGSVGQICIELVGNAKRYAEHGLRHHHAGGHSERESRRVSTVEVLICGHHIDQRRELIEEILIFSVGLNLAIHSIDLQ